MLPTTFATERSTISAAHVVNIIKDDKSHKSKEATNGPFIG